MEEHTNTACASRVAEGPSQMTGGRTEMDEKVLGFRLHPRVRYMGYCCLSGVISSCP